MAEHEFFTQVPVADVLGLSLDGGPEPAALGLFRISLATRDSGPRPIVFCGSSTTAGNSATTTGRRYVNLLTAMVQAAYPLRSGGASPATQTLSDAVGDVLTAGVQGINAGVGGTTASNYLTSTTMAQIGDLNPCAVVHMIGSNDYAADVTPSTYKSNVQAKLNTLDTEITVPHIHVLVHSYERMDGANTYAWSAYGDALRELAEAAPSSRVFIDLSGAYAMAGVPGTDPYDLVTSDNIHQGDAGHAAMADLLRAALGIRVVQVTSTPGDVTAPSTPTGLAATPGDGQVSLSWNAATDDVAVTGYRVYRDGVQVGDPAGTGYVDTGRSNGVQYDYQVSAVDAAGNESPLSAVVSATPQGSSDTVAPSAPTNLTATPGDAQVELSWTASTDNVGVTGYRVYRQGELIASPTATTYTNTGLTNGTLYTYEVTAADAAGNESPPSNQASATPQVAGGSPVLADGFDRANSTTTMGTADTGQTWAPATGTWGISSNRAYNTSTSSVTTLIESGVNDIDVSCVINIASTGSLPGLVFRALDANNRLGIFIDIPNDRVELWKNDASSTASRIVASEATMTLDYGVDYTVRAVAVGDQIQMYVNGVLRNTYTLTSAEASKFTGTGYTKVGLRGATQTRYDDLVAYAA